MKHLSLITYHLSLLFSLAANAHDWGLSWIAHPSASPEEQVWFRHTYIMDGKPRNCRIEIAGDGRQLLFVNGYIVSTDLPIALGTPSPDTVYATLHEATRFMRDGENVIAVWCCPPASPGRQLALTLFGTDSQGKPFAHRADQQWLCRTACATINAHGDETFNATQYNSQWNTDDGAALYLNAQPTTPTKPAVTINRRAPYTAMRPTAIAQCQRMIVQGDSLIYIPQAPFTGQVRVTFRGMAPGDTVSINDNKYICAGQHDEQACPLFTIAPCQTITITSPQPITPENITNVEAITIAPRLHASYQY